MRRSPIGAVTAGLALAAAAGCGQYLGYRVGSVKEISREERVLERGEPRELKVEILQADRGARGVTVEVKRVSHDQLAEVVVSEETRVHKCGKYHPGFDLLEPLSWGLDVVGGPELALTEGDWHLLCWWPPIDLIARLCGSYGLDGKKSEPYYAEHAPSYPRRVAQWLVWVLPGYTFGEGTTVKQERVRRQEVRPLAARLTESPLAQAAVSLRTSANPAGVLVRVTDAQGRAQFDLSPALNRTCRGRRVTLTAKAAWRKLKATAEKTFQAEELGVTWDKPRFRPDAPPDLVVETQFRDRNGNEMLDASEAATFTIEVHNKGKGEAFQVKVLPEIQGSPKLVHLDPAKEALVESILPRQDKSVQFTFRAEEGVPAQLVRVRFKFEEINGFEPEPVMFSFRTRPYDPPQLAVAKWSLDDDMEGATYGNGDGKLGPGEKAEITLILRNEGKGGAREVTAKLMSQEANVTAGTIEGDLGDVPAGKWAKAVFTVMANRRYNGKDKLPLTVDVSEARKKFAFSAPLTIGVGVGERPGEHVVRLTGIEKGEDVELSPLPELKARARKPMVGLDFSKGERYALLIGVEDYQDDSIGDLSYSIDDVSALRESLTAGGQFEVENVFLMTDAATKPNDIPTRLNILLTLKWLAENLKPEDTLLFAFSGHGETDRDVNFLIPVDGRLALPQDTSIPLKRVLEWLDACPAQRQVVMLDACHSGLDVRRKGKGLGGLAPGFENELQQARTEGRAVLSSCSKGEIAYEDTESGHGIFTQHVLEGLKGAADSDRDGKVTVHELNVYIRPRVVDWCRQRRRSPTQTPRARLDDTAGAIVLTEK